MMKVGSHFNYTKPGSDELNYYTYIPRDYNISEKVFYDLWTDLYRLFKKLRSAFKERRFRTMDIMRI